MSSHHPSKAPRIAAGLLFLAISVAVVALYNQVKDVNRALENLQAGEQTTDHDFRERMTKTERALAELKKTVNDVGAEQGSKWSKHDADILTLKSKLATQDDLKTESALRALERDNAAIKKDLKSLEQTALALQTQLAQAVGLAKEASNAVKEHGQSASQLAEAVGSIQTAHAATSKQQEKQQDEQAQQVAQAADANNQEALDAAAEHGMTADDAAAVAAAATSQLSQGGRSATKGAAQQAASSITLDNTAVDASTTGTSTGTATVEDNDLELDSAARSFEEDVSKAKTASTTQDAAAGQTSVTGAARDDDSEQAAVTSTTTTAGTDTNASQREVVGGAEKSDDEVIGLANTANSQDTTGATMERSNAQDTALGTTAAGLKQDTTTTATATEDADATVGQDDLGGGLKVVSSGKSMRAKSSQSALDTVASLLDKDDDKDTLSSSTTTYRDGDAGNAATAGQRYNSRTSAATRQGVDTATGHATLGHAAATTGQRQGLTETEDGLGDSQGYQAGTSGLTTSTTTAKDNAGEDKLGLNVKEEEEVVEDPRAAARRARQQGLGRKAGTN